MPSEIRLLDGGAKHALDLRGGEFEATFRHEGRIYEILVENPQPLCGGVSQIMVDETPLGPEKMVVPLVGTEKTPGARDPGRPATVKEKRLEH
jgi:hypothetical protein